MDVGANVFVHGEHRKKIAAKDHFHFWVQEYLPFVVWILQLVRLSQGECLGYRNHPGSPKDRRRRISNRIP